MFATTEAYGLQFRFPEKDQTVGPCLRDHGEFARVIVVMAKALLGKGTFLDVGANIGAMALPVAAAGNRVIAVEPHSGVAGLLADNAKLNGLSNIEVMHAAVSDHAGRAMFPTPPLSEARNFGNMGFDVPSDHLEDVALVTMDQIAPSDTTVVKIDVEGHERAVIAGARQTLEVTRPSWIIETSTDTDDNRAVIQTMLDADYQVFWFYSPFVTRLPPRKPPFDTRGDLNVLAIPAGRPAPLGFRRVDPAGPWPRTASEFAYLGAFGWEA